VNGSRIEPGAAALLALLMVTPSLSAQEKDAQFVDSLVAEFHANPGGEVVRRIGPCPVTGTWRRELLERLLAEVSVEAREAGPIINYETYNIKHCDDIPSLSAWFREGLLKSPSEHGVGYLVMGLWNSGSRENREAVVAAMFDSTRESKFRYVMAEAVAQPVPDGEGAIGFLHLMAEWYRRFGAPPSGLISQRVLHQARSEGPEGLAAKRAVLASWRARPDAPGSADMIALLADDAAADARDRGPTSTEWKRSVGTALEDALAGRLVVSEDVRKRIQQRIGGFRSQP